MSGAILQALDERGAKWADLPFSADELGEILSCVVCTEPYYGGDSSRLPHETCIHGHTCCVDCYTRLTSGVNSQAHTVTCPMCRTTTMTSRLRVLGETDGLLGMLVLRNRIRWACAARCGFSGRLAAVRAHTAKCARALVPCALCDAHVSRGSHDEHMLAAHARAAVRVRTGNARALSFSTPRVLLLPLGVSVVTRPIGISGSGGNGISSAGSGNGGSSAGGAVGHGGRYGHGPLGAQGTSGHYGANGAQGPNDAIAISVTTGGAYAQDRLVELELALFRDGTTECTCIDVISLARTGGTAHAVFADRVSVTCRVPLNVVPALGLVRVGGVSAVHLVGEALGESILSPTKPGSAPYAIASNVMVGIVEARVNERCWVREEGTGLCISGTVVRFVDGTAIVRTASSIVESPRVLCGAMRSR